ncbi:MAG: hypothetical protein JO186_04755 [Actinobacteria bacterium]|nr:hypothetical protein [Actinomycetota bacterium]MBV8598138.1 hypothetical protein [Actinomycetota bacterium]
MQTHDFFEDPAESVVPVSRRYARASTPGFWGAGERIVWLSALILSISAFTDWYAGSGVGVKLAVIGWHTGLLGKLVFFIGLVILAIVALRASGLELPPSIPESLVVLALGALATVFVLVRVISIPDSVLPANGRGIGIWISLLAAIGVVVGGLLRAAEEL